MKRTVISLITVVMLIMMTLLLRSVRLGLVSMVPLSVTIALVYGTVGLMGKYYDMPIAILSSLTLGLSIDFAIHFIKRSKYIKTHFPEGIPEENIKTDDWVSEMVEGTLKYFIHKYQK